MLACQRTSDIEVESCSCQGSLCKNLDGNCRQLFLANLNNEPYTVWENLDYDAPEENIDHGTIRQTLYNQTCRDEPNQTKFRLRQPRSHKDSVRSLDPTRDKRHSDPRALVRGRNKRFTAVQELERARHFAVQWLAEHGDNRTAAQFASVIYGQTIDFIPYFGIPDLPGSVVENRHTEVQLLGAIVDRDASEPGGAFAGCPRVVYLYTEYSPCRACLRYLIWFARRFPDVTIFVGYRRYWRYTSPRIIGEWMYNLNAPDNLNIAQLFIDSAGTVTGGINMLPTMPTTTSTTTTAIPSNIFMGVQIAKQLPGHDELR